MIDASLALSNLMNRKLRSYLTILGIVMGIAAIVALISLGQGMKTAIASQFSALGTDRIIVQAKQVFFGPPGVKTVTTLTKNDFDRGLHAPGVSRGAKRLIKSGKVEFNKKTKFLFVGSMPEEQEGRKLVEEIFRLAAAEGRLLKQGDAKKVVVGNKYTDEEQFGKAIHAGDRITVQGEVFEVVGVLEKLGQPQFDTIVLMPEDAMRALYAIPDEASALVYQAGKGQNPEIVAESIADDLRRFRHKDKGKEDFTVQTQGQLLGAFSNILNVVTAVLIGIAAISLLVGGLGVMNTMYTSVLERYREIGIMKAIGATNNDVLVLFLLESGLLGLVGGIAGVAIGILFAKIVEFAASQALGPNLVRAGFPWYLIAGALAVSLIVGILSGVLPARQASRLQPVEALRYE